MINKLELINQFSGEKFRELTYHSWQEVESLLITAGDSQQEWKHTKISERVQLVKNAMNYFYINQKTIANDINGQMGKPITQAMSEVTRMINQSAV